MHIAVFLVEQCNLLSTIIQLIYPPVYDDDDDTIVVEIIVAVCVCVTQRKDTLNTEKIVSIS